MAMTFWSNSVNFSYVGGIWLLVRMNGSIQDPETPPPSFLGGFTEGWFPNKLESWLYVTASLEFSKMTDVKNHQNLYQECPLSFLGGNAEDMEEKDYFKMSWRSGFWYTAFLDITKMIVDFKYHPGSSHESAMSS